MNTEKSNKSFIVLSDFHGIYYPLDKIVNDYINIYDCIYILGDATDRGYDGKGTGSIKFLEKIKNLCKKYPEKIIYIPGNHDEFLVGYALEIPGYAASLNLNGGTNTIKELDKLKEADYSRYKDLIKWLMDCPIQKIHNYNNKKYVLAHALFNQKLFDYNPNYNLKNYFQNLNSNISKKANQVLWFRKDTDSYIVHDLPNYNATMIIGHTPIQSRQGINLDLKNKLGNTIKVHCVDGGISYNGVLLKYDVSEDKKKNNNTLTSKENEILEKKEILLQKHILKCVDKYQLNCFDDISKYIPNNLFLSRNDCIQIINRYVKKSDIQFEYKSFSHKYYIYSISFIFYYIIEHLLKKYGPGGIDSAKYSIDNFLFGQLGDKGDFCFFTRDYGIRDLAMILGATDMKKILKVHNCSSASEYIDYKFSKNTKNKYKYKTNKGGVLC